MLRRDASIPNLAVPCPRPTAPGICTVAFAKQPQLAKGCCLGNAERGISPSAGCFAERMPAQLGLEELPQCQQCQGAAFPPGVGAGSSGKGTFPVGARQNPPREKETPPDYPDRLMISPQDIQMGTETPREPGTCFPPLTEFLWFYVLQSFF